MAIKKLSDDEIRRIQSLHAEGKNIPEIVKLTGKSTGVIDKYIKQPLIQEKTRSEPPVPIVPVPVEQPQKVQLQPTKPVVGSPYPEIPEPDEWLRSFLQGYRLKEAFIQAQCSRVKRRNTLPTPSDLHADLQMGYSGKMKMNPIMIRDIIEDYDFSVEEYLKERDKMMTIPYTRRRGIPLDRGGSPPPVYDNRGLPVRSYESQPPPQAYYPDQRYPDQRYPDQRYQRQIYDGREGIPIGPSPQQHYYPPPYPPYQHLETELDRFLKMQQLLGKTEEKTPMMEKYELENRQLAERINLLEEERKREIIDENNSLKNQIQQVIERRRELEGKLRHLEMIQSQKSVTESDVKLQELHDIHDLKKMEITEKGKTRETIANAVKTGFAQVGSAIARTASESGSEESKPMPGYTDGRHMWQAECPTPGCSTMITAPLSAKTVTCPGCGTQLEVSQGEQPMPLEQPSPVTDARFTVEPDKGLYEEPPSELPLEETFEEVPPKEKPLKDIEQETLEPTKPTDQVIEQEILRPPPIVEQIPTEKIEEEINTETLPPIVETKEFVCQEPGCGKSFTGNKAEMKLKGHMLHHIKEKKKNKK